MVPVPVPLAPTGTRTLYSSTCTGLRPLAMLLGGELPLELAHARLARVAGDDGVDRGFSVAAAFSSFASSARWRAAHAADGFLSWNGKATWE